MVQFQIDTDAQSFNGALLTHIGVLHEGQQNMRVTTNSLHHRVEALESASGNGNETTISVPAYADDASRDAAVTAPVDGMVVYNTAESSLQLYAGSWGNVGGGMQPVYCHVDCGDFGNQTPPGTTGPNWHYGNQLVPFYYTVAESTPGIYDYTTGRFTPGVAGVYKVTAVVHVYYYQENGRVVSATLHKNNTASNPTGSASTRIATGLEQSNNTYTNNYYLGFHMFAYVDTIVSLTSTDWLQLFLFSQSGFGAKASVEKTTKLILHRIA